MLLMIFMSGVIIFQTAFTVTAEQDNGLPFSSDLAGQLLHNFWLIFQTSYPLINPLPDKLLPADHAQSAQPVGPKITLCFPCLLVCPIYHMSNNYVTYTVAMRSYFN